MRALRKPQGAACFWTRGAGGGGGGGGGRADQCELVGGAQHAARSLRDCDRKTDKTQGDRSAATRDIRAVGVRVALLTTARLFWHCEGAHAHCRAKTRPRGRPIPPIQFSQYLLFSVAARRVGAEGNCWSHSARRVVAHGGAVRWGGASLTSARPQSRCSSARLCSHAAASSERNAAYARTVRMCAPCGQVQARLAGGGVR